jgi:signal transduction histidine kinase
LRVRQPVVEANAAYAAAPAGVAQRLHARRQEWEQGTALSGRILSSELSRFLLETKVRGGDKIAGLLITDRHGALVAASSEPDRYYFGEESWWHALHASRDGQVFISELIQTKQGTFRTPEETIDIAVPVLDDHQKEIIGAIKASFRFDVFFALINQIRIGQTGHAMLFDAAGVPLVCPILPRSAHRIPGPLMGMIVSAEPGWRIAADDAHGGLDSVVGFAPVRGLGASGNTWHIFIRQQPSESYAPIHEQVRNLALIGLVMIVLLAAMGRYVAARIAKPIQVLRKGVESISAGTYDGPLDIKTGDEFEDLAAAVHRMADNLRASRAELEALNRDLSRRVEEKTAEVTRQMQQLERSERLATLGKVASGIAHEVNNPLGIILNRIECIEAEAVHLPLPEELARDLSAIRAQAERISRVTKSVLSLSRGTATTLKPIDLNAVIRCGVAAARERLPARLIRLDLNLDPALPPVMGDRDKLETVVLNLVNNAVDAVQELGAGGVVTLQSRRATGRDQEWVEVTVSDNGPGIAPDVLHRVFDPFFTTKPAGQGTGLGLFLSYGIIAEHRGRMEAESAGGGAAFSFRLPAMVNLATVQQESPWELRAKS